MLSSVETGHASSRDRACPVSTAGAGAEVAYATGLDCLGLQVIDFAKPRVCIAMGYDGMIG